LKIRKIIISHLFILLLISSCSTKQLIVTNLNVKNKKLSQEQLKSWQHKDIISDSIFGISLDKAYQELIRNKKGKEIIVAVIDTQVDLNHEDLKNSFWLNKDEIPNNNIDDDNNGYIDDVHGWNFIGNLKGESLPRTNFEYVRVVKKYSDIYNNSMCDSIYDSKCKTYKKALKIYTYELKRVKHNYLMFTNWQIRYNNTKKVLKPFFPKGNYTLKVLNEIKTTDTIILKEIKNMRNHINWEQSDEWSKRNTAKEKKYIDYYLNINLNNRQKIVGDNPYDIKDTNYGFHNVTKNENQINHSNHSTKVTGIINANRNNGIGIKGISNRIKIMPLVVSTYGDEYDKDIALAIRYAVDNGAQVINMSSSKDFSTNPEWVQNALKYAEKHNVLFINCASNENNNTDVDTTFPNDIDNNGEEIVSNFINVGASTYQVNKYLVAPFSNYGEKNVDIFAPGNDIFTTKINNTYKFVGGTSYSAPIVSGVAALIWSHYPKLKAYEVKEIILESGISYDMDVILPAGYQSEKETLVPFKSLSKSGKIVNAYNALLLARHYKKWKKGKWKMKSN